MGIYTYNQHLRDLLKDAPCILAYDTAAEYLGLFNGFVYHEDARIYVCSHLHIPGTVQIAGLRRRVKELEQAKELGVGTAQDFAKAIAVAADFLH